MQVGLGAPCLTENGLNLEIRVLLKAIFVWLPWLLERAHIFGGCEARTLPVRDVKVASEG